MSWIPLFPSILKNKQLHILTSSFVFVQLLIAPDNAYTRIKKRRAAINEPITSLIANDTVYQKIEPIIENHIPRTGLIILTAPIKNSEVTMSAKMHGPASNRRESGLMSIMVLYTCNPIKSNSDAFLILEKKIQ